MADQRIQYTEEMVGAGHSSKADTLNRLALVEHNNDGTHGVVSDLIVRAPKTDVRSLMDSATRAAWVVSPGTVDVASAIQAALSGGGEVFFIGKDFLSTLQLTIPSNTIIRGISNRLTTIKQGANFTYGSFLSGNGISNILIEDIGINTQKGIYAGTETALYINSSLSGTDVTLNRVFCNGSTSGGLAISNTTRARVINCDVRDTIAADGIRIASCVDVIVDGNNIYEMTNLSATKRGVQIGSSNYVRASNNTVKGIPSTAYAFDFGGSSYVDMAGNHCQGGAGVDLEGASTAINIIGNTFVGGTAAGNIGIYMINGNSNIVNDVTISGNAFLNLFDGVKIEGHRHITIGNNVFRNMYGYGICVMQSGAVESDWITITGNNIDSCSLASAGMYPALYIRSISGTVTGNVVRGGSTSYDIQDYSGNSNVQIEGNVVGASGYSDSQSYRKADLWSTSIFEGSGSPEGAVAAKVGSIYRRLNGGAGTTLYVKESGAGNTGWVAK